MNAGRMRLPRNPSRPIVTWHRGSARAKIKQRAAPSKFRARPLIVSSLSPRSFYGEASATIATPYTYNDDLRRDPGESPGPQGGGTWFQRETSSLSWSRGYQRELSPSVHCSRRAQKRSRARFRANTLSVTLRPSPRSPERKTRFHARNCLVTRSRFVMPPYG